MKAGKFCLKFLHATDGVKAATFESFSFKICLIMTSCIIYAPKFTYFDMHAIFGMNSSRMFKKMKKTLLKFLC